MADIDKLTQIAGRELKAGEAFKARIVGKTTVESAGGEIVDGFIGATDHNVIILAYSLFGKRAESFPYSQVSIPIFNESENDIAIVLPGNETFAVTELLSYPDPNELFKFIKGKKSPPEKATFEAVSLTVQPPKK